MLTESPATEWELQPHPRAQALRVKNLTPQAVHTALKETESRATDLLPVWKVPLLCALVPRQRKALAAVDLIRRTTEDLIARCGFPLGFITSKPPPD